MMNNEQGILLYTISKPLIKSKSGVYQILKQFKIHVILFFLFKSSSMFFAIINW